MESTLKGAVGSNPGLQGVRGGTVALGGKSTLAHVMLKNSKPLMEEINFSTSQSPFSPAAFTILPRSTRSNSLRYETFTHRENNTNCLYSNRLNSLQKTSISPTPLLDSSTREELFYTIPHP